MKKFIKENYKVIIYIVLFVSFQTAAYYLGKLFEGSSTNIYTKFDEKIPFIPYFWVFYCIWYPALVVFPFLIYKDNKENLYKYFSMTMIGSLIAFLTFAIFPTSIPRIAFKVNNLSTFAVKTIFSTDNPTCCLPSLHCLICFYIIIVLLKSNLKKGTKITGVIVCLLIVLSTVFIKQHAILDVAASLLVAVFTYIYVFILNINPAKKMVKSL